VDLGHRAIYVRKFKGGKEPVGHADVAMTMIFTNVLRRGGSAVRSPVESLNASASRDIQGRIRSSRLPSWRATH
jgi:hypothetical protein